MIDFKGFQKVPRLSRPIIITEKLDGTNASIYIGEDGAFLVGSKNRWITPAVDNFEFALWANWNKDELLKLGPGHHFGEWWGKGINRGYGVDSRTFSLFNTSRWNEDNKPECCSIAPVLYSGVFDLSSIGCILHYLKVDGSVASPGFMDPEGIIIYHSASRSYFKKTIKDDEKPKGMV